MKVAFSFHYTYPVVLVSRMLVLQCFHSENVSNVLFRAHLRRRNVKTQHSPVILDLCLRKTRTGKSHDYRDSIVLEKLNFQNVFLPHENAKPAFSNATGFEERFRKAPFS